MRRRAPSISSDDDDDDASTCSFSSCSSLSLDEEEVNARMAPNWCDFRHLIDQRGFRLDTCRDVKLWYQQYWATLIAQGQSISKDCPGYQRACNARDENELCKDAGLPENLFRGSHCATGTKVVIKAVHLLSREYDIVRYMSNAELRNDPRNHLIPVLDLIEAPPNNLVFIVMEEWSPNFLAYPPHSLRQFLGALRQCIEHASFMHSHRIAHLDISIRNLLTDYNSRYAYIDFELSRRFGDDPEPRIRCRRGTDLPPELERGEWGDPYKADVWSLATLMEHACSLTGYDAPELLPLITVMRHETYTLRPTAADVLQEFDTIVRHLGETRL